MGKRSSYQTDIYIDSITGSAAAVLVCGISTQYLSSRQPEFQVCSEILAWIILPVLYKTLGSRKLPADTLVTALQRSKPPTSRVSLWAASICITAYYVLAVEAKTSTFLPALLPLILLAHKHPLCNHMDPPTAQPGLLSSLFLPLTNTFWGTTFVALFAVASIKPKWRFEISDILSIMSVAALLVVYVTLTSRPKPVTANRNCGIPGPFDIEDAIVPLSSRVVIVMVIMFAVQSLAFGLPRYSLTAVLVLGLSKASAWYFGIQTVCGGASRNFCPYILILLTGTTILLAHYCRHRNIHYRVHTGSIHAILGCSGFFTGRSIVAYPRPDDTHASQAQQIQIAACALVFLSRSSHSLPEQHPGHQTCPIVISTYESTAASRPDFDANC